MKYTSLSRSTSRVQHTNLERVKTNTIIISHFHCTHFLGLYCVHVYVLLDQRMDKFLLVYNLFSSNGLPIKAFAFFYFLLLVCTTFSSFTLLCPSFLIDSLFLFFSIFIALLLSHCFFHCTFH